MAAAEDTEAREGRKCTEGEEEPTDLCTITCTCTVFNPNRIYPQYIFLIQLDGESESDDAMSSDSLGSGTEAEL